MFPKKATAVLAVCAGLLTACASANDPAPARQPAGQMSLEQGNRDHPFSRVNHRDTYDQDGYLGFTETNPNLSTGSNPSYVNFGFRDADRIAELAVEDEAVGRAQVTIVGNYAGVRLYPDKRLNPEEALVVKERVRERLNRVIPRYSYDVRINPTAYQGR